MSNIREVLSKISQDYWAAINNSESNETESKEKIKAKEKKWFKKIICPNCGSVVETLSEPCIVCESKKQLELGENQ